MEITNTNLEVPHYPICKVESSNRPIPTRRDYPRARACRYLEASTRPRSTLRIQSRLAVVLPPHCYRRSGASPSNIGASRKPARGRHRRVCDSDAKVQSISDGCLGHGSRSKVISRDRHKADHYSGRHRRSQYRDIDIQNNFGSPPLSSQPRGGKKKFPSSLALSHTVF